MAATPPASSSPTPHQAGGASHARATVARISVRRLRLSWAWGRTALMALSAASVLGVLVLSLGARVRTVRLAPATPPEDLAAQGFALSFTRAYLTYDAADQAAHARGLAPFISSEGDADAGLSLPGHGAQHVAWADVVQRRPGDDGATVYTVAAQTDVVGLLYLTVGVRRRRGLLELDGYPALVGAPQSVPVPLGSDDDGAPGVSDAAVRQTVTRALANYLTGSADNLRADLAPGANVALPALHLRLDRLLSLSPAPGGAVRALVAARDGRGTTWTLAYELDLTRRDGRPLIQAIQTDPTH